MSGKTFAAEATISTQDTSFNAQDMLARLQSDGFPVPPSPGGNRERRRTRRRARLDGELPTSPLATEILEVEDQEGSVADEQQPSEHGSDYHSSPLI